MEYAEMKDRIAHIIRAKNLTAAEFALRLGIQPSNVSHLLAGRNNPSLEFVKKLKETFPEYNLDWIVMGKGPMTVSEPLMGNGVATELDVSESSLFAPEPTPNLKVDETTLSMPLSKELKQVVLVYADHTFEVLTPR